MKKAFEEHYEIHCSGIVNHCDLSKTHRTELKNVLKSFCTVLCQRIQARNCLGAI